MSLGLACRSIQENKSECFNNILLEYSPSKNWKFNDTLNYYADKFPLYKFIEDTVKYKCILNQKLDTNNVLKLFGNPSESYPVPDSMIYYNYCTYPPQGNIKCCLYYYTFIFSKEGILHKIEYGGCSITN